MEQRITVDSILDKKFSTVAKGFNQQEVDEYLDQICDEFDRRDAEMNTLRQEIAQLKAAQANGSNTVPQQTRPEAATDDSFREILEMAKRVKDQTIADAQTKASQILANAESEARQQLSDLTKQQGIGNAHAERLQILVAGKLVIRQCGGKYPTTGIRDVKHIEIPLQASVFSRSAVDSDIGEVEHYLRTVQPEAEVVAVYRSLRSVGELHVPVGPAHLHNI